MVASTALEPMSIIIDDADFPTQSKGFPGGLRTPIDSPSYPSRFNDTLTVFDLSGLTLAGPWTLQADGISMALYGMTPPNLPYFNGKNFNQTILVGDSTRSGSNTSDAKTFTSYPYPAPASLGLIVSTGNATVAGPISLGLMNFLGLTVDYMVVQVGEFTNIEGKTAFVDDTSGEIRWSGSWAIKRDYQLRGDCFLPPFPFTDPSKPSSPNFPVTFYPHGNSTHTSATVGDSFQFLFSGTSIAVYGISPGSIATDDWELNMTFNIDGTTHTTSYTASMQNGFVAPQFLYFSTTVSPGNHTLTATVVNVAGSAAPSAQIDYITYTPDFGTPHERPILAFPPSPSSSSSLSPTSASSPSSSATPTHRKKASAGVIGGSVVGAVVGLVLVAIVVWLLWSKMKRKRVAQQREVEPEPFVTPNIPARREKVPPSEATSTSGAGRSSGSVADSSSAAGMQEGAASIDERMRQMQIEIEGFRHQVRANRRGSLVSTAPPAYTDGERVEER
ncbi:hypothetical protein MIND_00279900 [Mycena indigotica]|uniref:Uncharacterized protein n=1 Tax=Mycena indigotica TaxID=2126181 RepID=A0A8H6T9Y5_9AGAR|nr:uncharacterized protein MIND_00279900 [Mycena indigotica]KAF7312657.1 hypothetical protein MIND_00279900 [Mycena indigotica]